MSSNAQRFASTVLAAFRAAGHYTDQEVGDAGGPSTTTMTKLRKVSESEGDMPEPRGDTYKKIDAAAEWAPGSARALWRDGVAPKRSSTTDRMREALGLSRPAPEVLRRQRSETRYPDSLDGFVERLADRLLEVEERLDALEMEVHRRSIQPPDSAIGGAHRFNPEIYNDKAADSAKQDPEEAE